MVDDNQQNQQALLDHQNNNVQIGMALIRMEEVDPVWKRAKNSEATRLLWARFFIGKSSTIQVQIPSSWKFRSN